MNDFDDWFNNLLDIEKLLKSDPSAEVLIENRPEYGWTQDQIEKYDKKYQEVNALRKK